MRSNDRAFLWSQLAGFVRLVPLEKTIVTQANRRKCLFAQV
jgi:hypothetical protein